jgi:hypothetical protein
VVSKLDAKTKENQIIADELYLSLKNCGRIESLLYISFFKEKEQNEGFEMVRSVPDAKKIYQNKLIETKDRLVSVGYMKKMYYGDQLKTLLVKSTPKPFIRYLNEIMLERRSDSKSADADKEYLILRKEEEALFQIINSEWFRSSVYTFIDNRRVDRQSLTSTDIAGSAMVCLGSTFDEITAIVRSLGDSNIIRSNMPTTEQIAEIDNFDHFSDEWVKKHFKGKCNRFVFDAIEAGCDAYPESNKYAKFSSITNKLYKLYNEDAKAKLYDYSKGLYLLCIPYDLSVKLNNVIRCESTIESGVSSGMWHNCYKKKGYSEFKEVYDPIVPPFTPR